jgi:low affinity Fe/Cu permease
MSVNPIDFRQNTEVSWPERFTQWITRWVGTVWAFILSLSIVIVWGITGPIYHYSDTWQLVINTGTSVVTFLMVFLIQRSQNKDTLAMQLKLNEILAALKGASNRLIDVENLSEEEVRRLHERYQRLASVLAKQDSNGRHSIEEIREEKRILLPGDEKNVSHLDRIVERG